MKPIFWLSLLILCVCSEETTAQDADTTEATTAAPTTEVQTTEETTEAKVITQLYYLDGEEPSPEENQAWLDDCTKVMQSLDFTTTVTCTIANTLGPFKVTMEGPEDELTEIEHHLEKESVTILGHGYKLKEEEEGPDPVVSLVSCLGIMGIMFVLMCGFFACKEWPNSPAKIEARQALRAREEKEREAEEKRKREEDAMFSV